MTLADGLLVGRSRTAPPAPAEQEVCNDWCPDASLEVKEKTRQPGLMNGHSQLNRLWIYRLSRSVICAVVVLSIGGFFWIPPTSVAYAIDILLRTYLIFLGTVMAHEGIHGLLGPTRATNF